MLELPKHKDYGLIHAYMQMHHPELQQTESPLFKHGIAVFNGTPFGAYIVVCLTNQRMTSAHMSSRSKMETMVTSQ